MKLMKRLGAIIMAVAIALSLGVIPAFATGSASATGSLTMLDQNNQQKTSSHYSAYLIASFDVSGGVYTNMKLTDAYNTSAVKTKLGLADTATASDILSAISKLDETGNASELADLANTFKTIADTQTATSTTENGKFDSLQYGYYLVIETQNNANDGSVISKPILVCIDQEAVTVNVKTSYADIEKKIVEGDILVDSSTAKVGDTVNYQSLSTFPTYPADATEIQYYVTDTFSTGLTFDTASVKVYIVDSNGAKTELTTGQYTLATTDIGGAAFRVTLTSDSEIKAWGNAGAKLLVTYSAAVNSSATYGITGNPNTIGLTYSTFPGVYTTYDTVITYTTKLVITKTNDSEAKLAGATFELYQKIGDVWALIDTQTTGDDGTASFLKLEQGTYKLVETKAPDGYNLLEDEIIFTVSAKNGTISIPSTSITVDQKGNDNALAFTATWESSNNTIGVNTDGTLHTEITNTAGFTLPGTGGIGTTIFTVAGIGIILLGSCMLMVYYKKNKESKQH